MSERPLETLMRTAMVGLRHAPDYDADIPEQFTRLLAHANFRSDAERFLHLLTLCQMDQALSRCPQPDEYFDELPDEPDNLLTLLDERAEQLAEQLVRPSPRQGIRMLAAVLPHLRCAVPDALFVEVLESGGRHSGDLYALAASARSRWMLNMTPAWLEQLSGQRSDWIESAQKLLIDPSCTLESGQLLALCQTYGSCKPALRQQLTMVIGRMPHPQLFAFVQACWSCAKVEARVALVKLLSDSFDWLGSPEGEAARQWLESLGEERATSVRQAVMQLASLLAQQMKEDTRSEFQRVLLAQLSQCLQCYILEPTSKKPDLIVPETLTAELQSLGIADSTPQRRQSISKPAARLGQLLRISGPRLWAQVMACSVEEASQRLIKSRFGEEVAPFIFESLLWHRESLAMSRLQKAMPITRSDDCQGVVLDLLGANPKAAAWYLNTLIELDNWEPLDSEGVCIALLVAGISLSEEASLRWWDQRLQQQFSLRRRDQEREFCVALLLSLPDADLDKRLQDGRTVDEAANEHYQHRCQLLKTAQAFKHALRTLPGTPQGEPL